MMRFLRPNCSHLLTAGRSIMNGYRMKPRIAINSPQEGFETNQRVVELDATITVPGGRTLVPPKAFANGVVGSQRRLLGRQEINGGFEYNYRWKMTVPSDRRIRIQVAAATDVGVAETRSVTIENAGVPPTRPRMFIVAAGINDYLDGQVPSPRIWSGKRFGVRIPPRQERSTFV